MIQKKTEKSGVSSIISAPLRSFDYDNDDFILKKKVPIFRVGPERQTKKALVQKNAQVPDLSWLTFNDVGFTTTQN